MELSRGKKTFRKFDDDADAESDGDDLGLLGSRSDLMDSSLDTRVRPLTRSSIKPRVLFPTARQRHSKEAHSGITDEEATTDIDDHASLSEPDVEVGHAADANLEQSPVTPPAKTTSQPPLPRAQVRALFVPMTGAGHWTMRRCPLGPSRKRRNVSAHLVSGRGRSRPLHLAQDPRFQKSEMSALSRVLVDQPPRRLKADRL